MGDSNKHYQPSETNRNRRRNKTRSEQLLCRLVNSRFFQFIIGNEVSFKSRPRKEGRSPGFKPVEQSLLSSIVDLFLFALLVAISPLIALSRLVNYVVSEYWWVKFVLGITTGVSCFVAIYLLFQLIGR